MSIYEPAQCPEDLARLFLSRANRQDVEGVVALYAPEAVLVPPGGSRAVGTSAIRTFYRDLFRSGPVFQGEPQLAVICGELALTSTRFSGSATAEVARRQPDDTWLWVIGQPNIVPG